MNELQFEPFSIPGVGLPKFWCLEDYSEFNEYLADDERVEDPEWGLAAQRFDQRGRNLYSSA